MKVRICPNCKRAVDIDSKYCGFCSFKIPSDAPKVKIGDIRKIAGTPPERRRFVYQRWFGLLAIFFVFMAMLIWPAMEVFQGTALTSALKGLIDLRIVITGWPLTLPFLVLFVVSAVFAFRNKEYTQEEFIGNVAGLLFVFVPYAVFTLYTVRLIASAPGALIGFILYPISMPVFIPLLYIIGQAAARVYRYTRKQRDV